jgi:DNA topoisomerase-1
LFKSHFWLIFMKFQKKLAWAGLLVYSETRLLKWTIGGMEMAKYLVIVESPAKVKTIKKFLGSNYEVAASNGHVRDFPKSSLGIDVEHDYEPKYITIRGKGEVLANLRKLVKKADKVYLATDPDREGEAISWHLYYALKLENKKTYRITFNEITKTAVKESLQHAREIDMDLVDAQQARRCLDRMIGYRISPLLWAKIKRGLSAGRVQSVALRIICDREKEIDAFIPEEYWTLNASFAVQGEKKPLVAKYYGTGNGKTTISNKEELEKIKESLKGADYRITEVKKGERTKKAPLPFTTSTLQQEASKVLNFSPQKTMRLAQQLYEGVEVKGEGTIGLITYLRTDSTRVSEEAEKMAKEYIEDRYGAEYAGEGTERKPGQKIQDAHEAIRPTAVSRIPLDIKDQLPRDLFRLYQLIWKRFTASRMQAAKYETVSVKIGAGEHIFTVASSKLLFDGFMSVYTQEDEEKEENNLLAGSLSKDTKLTFEEFEEKQHFTQPPAHYTEASLVRELEELGIGRPSTYAPTITTIMARHYVVKENKNLFVTELGEVVNNMMQEAFPAIVDVNFTANLETLLDGVGEGKVNWKTVVSNFYPDLDEAVKKAEQDLAKVQIADEESDEVCEHCGRKMVIKYGPHGKFLACPGFPECRNTKPYFEKIGVACPKCGKDIVIKKTKKGRKYYGCIGNPDCDFMVWQKPSSEKCPKCGSMMLQKGNKLVCMNEECGFIK